MASGIISGVDVARDAACTRNVLPGVDRTAVSAVLGDPISDPAETDDALRRFLAVLAVHASSASSRRLPTL